MTRELVALDLFAGSGWGVACQQLGIVEHGVEIMPEAIATREAAGMHTAFHDVWAGIGMPWIVPPHALLIASPPCQTFSPAGNGAGRRALGEVLTMIDEREHEHDTLRESAKRRGFDDRTALVLAPLAYIWQHRPRYVALEQVPTVLPVWEAYAGVLRSIGYSVDFGYLNAEQYGVPQTRKRAILVAELGGEARLPTPTHSKYHVRDPKRLDPGVLPWVSMAEALDFGLSDRPSPTVTGGGVETGGAEPIAKLARYTSRDGWKMRSNYGTRGNSQDRGERSANQPAATITSKANRAHWMTERTATTIAGLGEAEARARYGDRAGTQAARLTAGEAATLQTYPAGFTFAGGKSKQFLQIGNAVPPLLARRILETLTQNRK